MIHPVMTVVGLNDPEPGMRLVVKCTDCGEVVSDTAYDASRRPPDEVIATEAERDGREFLQHAMKRHGLRKEQLGPPVIGLG